MITEQLLCAKHCPKRFPNISTFKIMITWKVGAILLRAILPVRLLRPREIMVTAKLPQLDQGLEPEPKRRCVVTPGRRNCRVAVPTGCLLGRFPLLWVSVFQTIEFKNNLSLAEIS